MDIPVALADLADDGRRSGPVARRRDAFLCELRACLPSLIDHAAELDRSASFPFADIAALAACGALLAPFPADCGGLGLGTDPCAAADTALCLRILGYGHVAIGRLMEAHINAVRLLHAYAAPPLLRHAAADAAAGRLIGLWVTDAPGQALRAEADGRLHGRKAFCSGAGAITRAVVTCACPDGSVRMAYLDVEKAAATPLASSPQGVRAATTGQVDFGGGVVPPSRWVGGPGDYLREPLFSAGAWRTTAVTAGCLARLVDLMLEDLRRRGRADAPAQQARIGRAWIARETARSWIGQVAEIAEDDLARPPDDILAQVNFARIAVEMCCVEALALAERSIGLQAFLAGTDIERVRRDLGTYLRQPALDEILAQAASHVAHRRIHGP